MSVIIKGGISNILADVDTNNNLKVNLPTTLSGAGYASIVGEVDAGTVTGTKLVKPLDVSQDYRLRSGIDKIIWQDTFNHVVLNNSKYLGITSSMTVTLANGFLNLNAGNSVTLNQVARVQTFKSFSLFNTYPIYIDIKAKFSATLQVGNVVEFGFGYAATTATPTDGVFFRATSGELNAVINSNGSEITVSNIFTPQPNIVYHFAINIGQDACLFWVNDILVATVNTPTGLGGPVKSNSVPLLFRNYNNGTPAQAVQFNIGQIGVSLGDMNDGKDWATVMSTNGQNSINSPDGAAAVGTGTYTANFANSVVPATATLSNTAAGYGPLILGGQFTFAAVAGVETDYVLFAYLNPAGTSAIPAKTLVITGVKIYSYVSVVAVATTATVFQWAIGVGTTAITLATADSVTTGTRAARRLGLGMQSWIVGAAVGTLGQTVDTRLSAPLIVEAGTYCQILLKIPLGTATATQFFRGIVNVNGYFE